MAVSERTSGKLLRYTQYSVVLFCDNLKNKSFLCLLIGTRYWTSASFDTTSNVWRWANSQPLPNSAPWLRGYPNNPTSNLRVLIYRTNQFDPAWRTEDYTRMERYICEVPARQILSDGPGLYNYNTHDIASPCDLFKQENWV